MSETNRDIVKKEVAAASGVLTPFAKAWRECNQAAWLHFHFSNVTKRKIFAA